MYKVRFSGPGARLAEVRDAAEGISQSHAPKPPTVALCCSCATGPYETPFVRLARRSRPLDHAQRTLRKALCAHSRTVVGSGGRSIGAACAVESDETT
jgi:hypothetical protein